MKTMKKMLSILFILVLFVQSASLSFALSDNEKQSYSSDEKKLHQSDEADLVKQVQKIRKKEGTVSYSKKELAEIKKVTKRADVLTNSKKKLKKYVDSSAKKASSNTKKAANLSATFSAGDGTVQNPYVITTPEQMASITQNLSACYALANDIDMKGISWTPIKTFTGQFNGNEHKISNLTIKSTSAAVGLFGVCNGATIKNFTLHDADISGSTYVGAFAGIATNTILSNLILNGSKVSGGGYVGGIVGAGDVGAEIYNCSNNGTVNATDEISGGIAGLMNGTAMDDCFFNGKITGTNNVGGIAGLLQCDVNRCTNAGDVSGDTSVGGFAGLSASLAGRTTHIYYCYNYGTVSGRTEVAGIAGYALSSDGGMMFIYYGGNSGKVTATGSFAGGITGDSGCDLYISKCYNTGKIYADDSYGGLVGRLNISTAYDGSLVNSYNAGNIAQRSGAGSLIGDNFGILVNKVYYLSGYAPPVGYNGAPGYTCKTTPTSSSELKSIQTAIGNPFVADTEWINRGYPIIDGINYTFDASHKFDYPIVVIPGIVGSELYEGNDQLWLSLTDGPVKRLELTSTGESVNNITVVNDDNFGTFDTYKDLVTSLQQEYGTGEVYFFAYDWRLDNTTNANKLRAYVQNVVGSTKVNIVAHSMGGLIASRYIKDNSQNVNKFISLGAPYLGSPKVPYIFSTGRLIVKGGVAIAADGIKSIAPHMTSAYQLLPYRAPDKYIALAGGLEGAQDSNNEFDFIENNLKMGNTISPIVKGAFLDKSTSFMESIHTSSDSKTGTASISSSALELVDSYAISGTGKETINKTIYDSEGNYLSDLTFTFGDGTVPDWSANINGLIQTKQYNLEHTELVSDPVAIAKVKGMLNGHEPEYSYVQNQNNEHVVLRVDAEADVSISDGNDTLTNTDGKQNTETDFGSMYVIGENEDIIIFALSADKTYDVKMDSFESDKLDYDIRFFNSKNKLVEERSFNNLSVTKAADIITDTNRKNTVLSIDRNNNGVIDKKLKPDKINK